jgi:hypothetical protein
MDLVTYCPDTEALLAEVKEKFPNKEDAGRFIIEKSPTIRKDNETLALVRVNSKELDQLRQLETLNILGTFGEILNDPDKKAIYDRIYPPREITYLDDQGVEKTRIEDRRFAIFA